MNWFKFFIFLSIILFLISQFLFIKTQNLFYVFIIFISLLLFAIVCFIKNINLKCFTKNIAKNFLSFFQLNIIKLILSLFFALFGMFFLKISSLIIFFLFILSGIFLLFIIPEKQKILKDFYLDGKNYDISFKEIEYFLVFILTFFVFFVRFYNFDSIPPGSQGHEGTIAASYKLLKSNYIPFISDGLDWPTWVYYLGIFFSDIFGFSVLSYRFSSAIIGGLSVIAFYFVARQITSPFTALIFSFVYSVQEVFLIFSRMAGPHIICFIPHILAFGLLLQAIKNNKWWMFLAAGMAAGFGLHAYWSGRTVPFIFLFWFIWLFLFYRKEMPSIKNQLIFWLGFLIISGPVVYVAITNPDIYWGYIKGINPNQSKGITGYLNTIKERLPVYIQMFHIRSDLYWGFKTAYVPIFDYVLQYFFPVGFFMCLFTFWTPLSSFLIAAFCAGMLPGILGGDNLMHPTTNRIIMVYPIASLFAAIAFEKIRKTLLSYNIKFINIGLIFLGFVITLWSIINGLDNYFNKYMKHPAVITSLDYASYLSDIEAKKNIDKQLVLTHFLIDENVRTIFYLHNRQYILPFNYDGFLILDETRDYLFLLPGHLEQLVNFLYKYFPNSKIKKYYFDKLDHEFYKKNMLMQEPFANWPDPFNKEVVLISMSVFKEDIKKFHDLIDDSSGNYAQAFEKNFCERYSGKKSSFSGAIILDTNYFKFYEESKANTFNVRFELPWTGWQLFVDGIQKEFNRSITLSRGIHFFTLKGNIPVKNKGEIPLKIYSEGFNYKEKGHPYFKEELIEDKKVIAFSKPVGLKYKYINGMSSWNEKPVYEKQEFSSIKHISYGDLNCPFSIVAEGWLSPIESGTFEFMLMPFIKGRIFINNILVYDNINYPQLSVKNVNVDLEKGKKYKININYQFYCADPRMKVFCVYIKGPQDTKEKILPIDWVSPY